MRRATLLTTLVALLLVAGACEDESTNPVQSVPFSPAPGGESSLLGGGWEPTSLEILESLEYEEIEGSIILGSGGIIYGTLSTWPGSASFAIQVAPNALPGEPGETVWMAIRVPTYESYMDHSHLNNGAGLPLIMRLEPSHLNFLEPVIVYGTYMTWEPWVPPPSGDMELWNLWTSEPDVDTFDLEDVTRTKNKVTVRFEASHFSGWETGGPLPNK